MAETMKVIGLMVTWNNLEFLKCSLPQALSFCDELILVEGCHSKKYSKHSTDGTCKYIESIRGLPKLRVMDFAFRGRYDIVQRKIRQEFPKKSALYKAGNWIIHWDDDMFFFNSTLSKLRIVMKEAKEDLLTWVERHFIYNFRFSSVSHGSSCYRIVDGLFLRGINTPRYPNGKLFQAMLAKEIKLFHYNFVKKPERFNARMVMSIEKGTTESVGNYKRWMSVKWEKDEDIFKSRAIIKHIRPHDFVEELNIYTGKHPEAVDNHPWRYINDIRKVKNEL